MPKRARKAGKVPGVLERRRQAVFMRRTYTIYRHLGEEKIKGEKKPRRVELPFTLEQFRAHVANALKSTFGCRYCGEALKPQTFSGDHDHPRSRGGPNTLENLQIICVSCNTAKGEMSGREFEDFYALLSSFEEQVRSDVIGRLKAGASVKRLKFLRRSP